MMLSYVDDVWQKFIAVWRLWPRDPFVALQDKQAPQDAVPTSFMGGLESLACGTLPTLPPLPPPPLPGPALPRPCMPPW